MYFYAKVPLLSKYLVHTIDLLNNTMDRQALMRASFNARRAKLLRAFPYHSLLTRCE